MLGLRSFRQPSGSRLDHAELGMGEARLIFLDVHRVWRPSV